MTAAPHVLAIKHINEHKIGVIVSVASLVLIGLTLYSLHLQIKHTKLQLSKFESNNKQTNHG